MPEGSGLVRLRLRQREETYHGRTIAQLVPLEQPSGTRSYVHAKPYLAARIATPSWEDIYDRSAWQAFLTQHGYAPATSGVFLKELGEAEG